MTRTEPINVGVARPVDPQLRELYAFAWAVSDPENTVSALAVVRAEVEHHDRRVSRVILRPGQVYGCAQGIRRVWITSTVAGVLSLDVADEPGDRLEAPLPRGWEGLIVASKGRVLWDSGMVPGGAGIASPVLDTRPVETVSIWIDNLAGTVARAPTRRTFLEDGVTAFSAAIRYEGNGVASGAVMAFGVGPGAMVGSAANPAGLAPVGPFEQFGVITGGAGAARMLVIGR